MAFTVIAAVMHQACAPAGRIHSEAPVSWSISSSDSPTSGPETVCESGQSPCALGRTTDARPSYATFVVHVWGPPPTKFTGSVFVGYLLDPDPRHYKSDVELASNGQDVHHRIFSRVTDVPGEYTVRIQLEESGTHLTTPRAHDITVPVTVR